MEIILRSNHVAEVPKRWDDQYPSHTWEHDKREIAYKLLALPTGFTAEQCNEIIGNTSWTRFNCDECKQQSDKLIYLDDNPNDYEGNRFSICLKCLRKAIKLIKED